MSVPPPKRENLLFNIVCNIAVPSVVLTYGSKAAWLGPKGALIVALAFPLGYALYDLKERKKFNFISAIGFLSILITGSFALMKLDPFWFAVKEAAVPAVIGLVVLASMGTRWPLVREMLYNPQVIDVPRIDAVLAHDRGLHWRASSPAVARADETVAGSGCHARGGTSYSLQLYLAVVARTAAPIHAELSRRRWHGHASKQFQARHREQSRYVASIRAGDLAANTYGCELVVGAGDASLHNMRGRRSFGDRRAQALSLRADPALEALVGPATRFEDLPAALPGLLNPAPGQLAPLCPLVTYGA